MIADLVLTIRQRQALAAYVRLASRKEAARELGVSVDTVRAHLAECRRRLGVTSTMQAAVVAVARGIIEADDCVTAA